MKKFFIILYIFLTLSDLKVNAATVYNMEFFGKNYTCHDNNCYDIKSFKYNKKKNIYCINMIIDLMNWNLHEEYPSPYDEGFISHLIYKTTLHGNKISVKCVGFISRKILVTDINQIPTPDDYLYLGIYDKSPTNIKKFYSLNENFLGWTNWNDYKKLIKTLANNP